MYIPNFVFIDLKLCIVFSSPWNEPFIITEGASPLPQTPPCSDYIFK